MKGFFELEAPKLTKPKANKKPLDCNTCGLYKGVKSPRMPVTGKGRQKAFLLGEGPGRHEDEQNKQFVGEAGDVLREAITECGYQLDRDFWKQNAIRCRPTDAKGNNRTPTPQEIQCCEQFWRKEVAELKPKFIFLLGAKAVEAFYSDHSHPITSDLSIGRWNRTCVPDVKTGGWVISLYHPSFAVRTPEFKGRFKRDMKWALEQLNLPSPGFPDWGEFVEPVMEFRRLQEMLEEIIRHKPPLVIDYETSQTRPYRLASNIWSIGAYPMFPDDDVGVNPYAFSFPYGYPGHWDDNKAHQVRRIWTTILADPNIPKIAQSIQMEESWSRRVLKQPVEGWVHDTMVCSHVINEHQRFTGLDFQVFINWGYEYGEDIAPFKSKDPSTGFNRMHEVPLQKLLLYNGKDALFTGMLYEKQLRIIGGTKC